MSLKGAQIKDDRPDDHGRVASRERVVAAIYETVIRPELYDSFMDVWGAHLGAALEEVPSGGADREITIDPGLQAHFVRAHEILEQIGRRSQPKSLSDQVARAPGIAVLLDRNGRVVAASAAGAALIGGVKTAAEIRADLPAHADELLAGVLARAQSGDSGAATVVLATGRTPRHLMARLVTPRGTEEAGPSVLIEALEYQWSETAEAMLITSFGLSGAEVDVVRHLLAGETLKEIAERSGRSEHTVRNQAKAVLAKTGAPSQVDLIRLVVFLINQASGRMTARESALSIPEERMEMSTGLGMQLFRAGAPDGRPVIFLHGMLDGPAPLQFNQAELMRRGLCVLAPIRPGFGTSDPIRRADQVLDITVRHVEELIARERLSKPVLLGNLGGGVFAHVAASRLGRKVGGVVTAAGNVPIRSVAQFNYMAPRQRVVAYTARYAPKLLPTILRAGIAQVDGAGIDDFTTALFRPETHDHAAIRRVGCVSLMQAGFRFSVQQGHLGFATDSHIVVRDWSSEIRRPASRAICLVGRHDPVLSADDVVAAMGQRPNHEVRVFEDAGQLLFYEHPDRVLDAVEEVAGVFA